MCINWLKKIGNKAKHNAFVDLCVINNHFYCCYREANNHVSGDGNVCILKMSMDGTELSRNRIILEKTDLRDPKLSVTPNGNILLIAYARQQCPATNRIVTKNLAWISQSGHSWSSATEFASRGWWLWRLRWHQGIAFGFAYNRRANAIHLYSGNPRRSFHLHQTNVLSLTQHQKGYPNESDIIFIKNTAFALVRRDADTYSAQLGRSTFPFKKWFWQDLACYIGGPTLLPINSRIALVAGRVLERGKLVTGLLRLDLYTGSLQNLLILPSAGDNSYPGLVMRENRLYVAYYSSHEDNKSSVYLANIDIDYLMKSNKEVPVTRANVA